MGHGSVEHGKEGLSSGAVLPVCLAAGLVPQGRIVLEVRVVVLLAVVGAVIPALIAALTKPVEILRYE